MELEPIYNKQTIDVKKHTEINDDIKELCNNLLEFAKKCTSPLLAGLAANQMSNDGERIMENICFILREDKTWITAINPSIIKKSKEKIKDNQEGCLTWPKKMIIADRYESVVVSFTDLKGKDYVIDVDGFEAIVWQHEINHLNGVNEVVFNKTGKIYGPSTLNGGTIVLDKKKVGPNKPCLCGSGKKYKKCCG